MGGSVSGNQWIVHSLDARRQTWKVWYEWWLEDFHSNRNFESSHIDPCGRRKRGSPRLAMPKGGESDLAAIRYVAKLTGRTRRIST